MHTTACHYYFKNSIVIIVSITSEIATKHWDCVFFLQCFAFKPLMCLIYQLTVHYRTPPVFISMLCFLLWSWITFCTPTRTAIRAITKVKRIAGHEDSYNIHKQNYITPPHGLHRWPAACMDVEIFKACQMSGGINQTCSAAGTFTRAHIHRSKHEEEEEGSWLGHGLDRWSRSRCTPCVWLVISFLRKSLHSFSGGVSVAATKHGKILWDAGVVCCILAHQRSYLRNCWSNVRFWP